MMARRFLRGPVLAAAVFAMSGAAGASAQVQMPRLAAPGQLPAIDLRTQAAIVDSITATIDTLYVIKDTGDRIIDRLRSRLKKGAYRGITDPAEFALKLDADARGVYDDHHFGIRALLPNEPGGGDEAEDPTQIARFHREQRGRNFGFGKVEILPGNVGYLKLTQFASTDDGGETAVAAMNFLANADAVIIDLRGNPGGSASMIKLIASYLLKDSEHLITWYVRDLDEDVQSWSFDYVPGRRIVDVPVYVLADRMTGSAAEEFTFDMQHLKRGTVVGDTTGGGGHTAANAVFHFDGFRIGMRVPYGRAFDPKTGRGWEGTGVIPDVAVPSEQALDVAHKGALDRLIEGATDDEARFPLLWVQQDIDSRLHPLVLTSEHLGEYAGRYGPRSIFVEDGRLYYQREGRPRMELEPMGKDLFRVPDVPYFRVRFQRDETGRIVRLVGLYDNGRQDGDDRS